MELYTVSMSDWDAAQYHRLSDPQRSWGLRVLDRLAPAPGERILDIGCGTGRLTSEIRTRVPSVQITAIDRSRTMLIEAKRASPPTIGFAQADAVELPFEPGFDAVFSTATFHWVPDHPRLFSEIHRVLVPGGRLVSQAGGGPNLARLYTRTAALAREPVFARSFEGWQDPWTFAGIDETRARLEHAGFREIDVSLEPAPTTLPGAQAFGEFVTTVCLRKQLHRLSEEKRDQFLRRIIEQAGDDEPPFTLDYWRLNIDGRKG
jgi:trans-aconitate 2-methyltransferase